MDKRKKRRARSESTIRLEHQKKESKVWYEEAKSHAKTINLQSALSAYNKSLEPFKYFPMLAAGKRIEYEAKKRTVQKRQRRRRGGLAASLRGEELYTDKDRAAAVNMGTKDIKHSLKEKRQADRSSAMRIPAEAEPGTFLALGNYEMSRGDVRIAREFIDKALELNPNEKNALVARSRCYVLLGQPENGLKDAEAALEEDKTFFKAVYQKAESLYYLGDFEHSLMFYHRGHKLRPDHVGFKLGIQKSQKAIENAIGVRTSSKLCDTSDTSTLAVSKTVENSASSSRTTVIAGAIDGAAVQQRITSSVSQGAASSNNNDVDKKKSRSLKSGRRPRLLRELSVDKLYLDNLLTNPNLKCKNKEDDVTIVNSIKETIDYLNSRQEFWRQQLSPNLK